MSELMWIRSHVERLLQEHWPDWTVKSDKDGDYFYRVGTAACWVSILPTEPIMVHVFAHAASGLKASLRLYRELNDIQRRTLSATVTLNHDLVVVSQTISPIGLTEPVLCQAITAVGGVADDIGLLLAGMFGGSTPFPAGVDVDADAR